MVKSSDESSRTCCPSKTSELFSDVFLLDNKYVNVLKNMFLFGVEIFMFLYCQMHNESITGNAIISITDPG